MQTEPRRRNHHPNACLPRAPVRHHEPHPPRCSGPALSRVRGRREREGRQVRVRRAEACGRTATADALLHRLRHTADRLTRAGVMPFATSASRRGRVPQAAAGGARGGVVDDPEAGSARHPRSAPQGERGACNGCKRRHGKRLAPDLSLEPPRHDARLIGAGLDLLGAEESLPRVTRSLLGAAVLACG